MAPEQNNPDFPQLGVVGGMAGMSDVTRHPDE